jgi:hypothetical protein
LHRSARASLSPGLRHCIGHEIEADLQAYGYPILWMQHFPTDPDLMDWIFGNDIRDSHITSAFDIRDVWSSSYSANTNELLWGAKIATRVPWISCAMRLTSYECGMDQPTFTPVQEIIERSGTLFFSFQELGSTKPAGSVKIRVETIACRTQIARHHRAQKSHSCVCQVAARRTIMLAGPTPDDQGATGYDREHCRHDLIDAHSAEHDVGPFTQRFQKKTSNSVPSRDSQGVAA